MDTDIIYSTKTSGDFKILKYTNASNISIEFVSTGFKTTTRAEYVRNGSIKDPLYPSIFGVGYLGIGRYRSTHNGKYTREYSLWRSMLRRCYDESLHLKYPTYKECRVCEEWLCFQAFAEWVNKISPEQGLHLDKDMLAHDSKVYSPQTCKFISPQDNAQLATNTLGRVAVFNDKTSGVEYEVRNLTQFAKANGLNQSALSQLIKGTRKTHKGLILSRVFYDKNY